MIAYRVGNDYVMEIKRVVAGKNGTGIFNGVRFDEIWTNPQHARTCRSFFETVYRCPVRIVPHIWDSFFIDKLIGELPSGLRFGYAPGAQDKRIAIFEPNINVVKTAPLSDAGMRGGLSAGSVRYWRHLCHQCHRPEAA